MIRYGDTSLHMGGGWASPRRPDVPGRDACSQGDSHGHQVQKAAGWLWLGAFALGLESRKAFQGKGTECTTVQRLMRK